MSTAVSDNSDPFDVLGLPRDAGESEARERYLQLVKQYPPDKSPEKFREIRAAYEAIQDPLVIARRMIRPPDMDVPEWAKTIEDQKKVLPRLTPGFVLSLGNRDENSPAVGPTQ